jgi:hypothetical protein
LGSDQWTRVKNTIGTTDVLSCPLPHKVLLSVIGKSIIIVDHVIAVVVVVDAVLK